MATIQDVARLARVSVSSVSNVLNHRTGRMRAETRARIEEAIRKLDYRPSQIARQLKTGRARILGLLVPTTANPSFAQLALAMELHAWERYGHRILLCNTYRDQDQEAAMFNDLRSFGVNAVIVVSSMSDERHVDAARRQGLTVVSYDLGVEPGTEITHDHVLPDNHLAGRLAVQHLVAHGHARLAFLTPRGPTYSRQQKIRGFQEAIDEAGGPVSGVVIEGETASRFGDTELAAFGYESARRLLALTRPPTAVVTVNDMIAMGLMAGIRDHGLSVPEDVSVIGMDDLAMAEYFWPPLTSIHLPMTDMAHTLVDRAMLRVEQPELPAREIRFAPVLKLRRSVASPRAVSADAAPVSPLRKS